MDRDLNLLPLLRRGALILGPVSIGLAAAAAGLSVLSERMLGPAVGLGLLMIAIRLAGGRGPFLAPRLDWPLLGLLLMLPVTLLVTALPERTTPQVLRLLTGIFLAEAVIFWAVSPARLGWLAAAFCGLGLAAAVAALFAVQWDTEKFRFLPLEFLKTLPSLGLDRVHPNVMAGALVLLFAGLLGGLAGGWARLGGAVKIPLALLCLLMGVVLVFTQSRGALLGAGAALALVLLLQFKRGWLVLLLGGLGLAVFGAWAGPQKVLELLLASTGTGNSVGGRLEIWSGAVRMIGDFPLTGIGMGSFSEASAALYPFTSFGPALVPHAHNLYLQVAVDLGLPGLAAWLALNGGAAWSAWQVYRQGRPGRPGPAGLGLGLLCAQAALLTHGLLDAVTWDTRPAVLVWALWGAAFAAWKVYCQKGEKIG